MASVWESITGFLDAIASNPVYILAVLSLIALLIIWLTVHYIRKIRGQEVWVHQAWGAKWKGR